MGRSWFEPRHGKKRGERSGIRAMLRTYRELLGRFLRFSMVSAFVSVLDIVLFWLLTEYCLSGIPWPIIWGTVIARGISASINYVMNRQLVFKSNEDRRKSAGMFVALTVVQGTLSALGVHILEILTSGDPVVLKVVVDVALFFLSYKVQQRFIFSQ